MISIRPLLYSLVGMACCLSASMVLAEPVTIESNGAREISDLRPEFMYFKKAVITRTGKYSLSVDITLEGKIPFNIQDDRASFYIGFDIDNDASTGGSSADIPGFGQDVGVAIAKKVGTSRFDGEDPGDVRFKGKVLDLKLTGLKVNGDKISYNLRSELFGMFPSFKCFFSSSYVKYDRRGEVISDVQVSALPITEVK